MARQDVVRALVPRDRLDGVIAELREGFELGEQDIEVALARPGTYRDERPDLELRSLVRTGRRRIAVAAAIGAAIGLVAAVVIPQLRDLVPVSLVLFAFLGAGLAVAITAGRTVQTERDEGDRPETLHHIEPGEADDLRVVTVRTLRERPVIADHLADRDLVLLDSLHPRVGENEPGARPAEPDAGDPGPPDA